MLSMRDTKLQYVRKQPGISRQSISSKTYRLVQTPLLLSHVYTCEPAKCQFVYKHNITSVLWNLNGIQSFLILLFFIYKQVATTGQLHAVVTFNKQDIIDIRLIPTAIPS